MKGSTVFIPILVAALAVCSRAEDKKKKQSERGMIESMEAVPCGAKQRGLTGLGSVFGSVGIEHVNSDEKLCPQYLLRTDEMDYQIRPVETKHPVVLPVGHEGEFKIKKDEMRLRVADGDRKVRAYRVVEAKPVQHEKQNDTSKVNREDLPRKDGTSKGRAQSSAIAERKPVPDGESNNSPNPPNSPH
jgi:hypothetical protein